MGFDLAYICAPSGFGKRSHLRELVKRHDAHAIIDLHGFDEVRDVLCAVASTVGADRPAYDLETPVDLSREINKLCASVVSAGPSLLVFNAVDRAVAKADTRKALSILLQRMPKAVSIVVVSECQLPFALHYRSDRTNIVRIDARELLLDEADIRSAARALKIDADTIVQLSEHCKGWHYAVRTYLKLARQGRLTLPLNGRSDPGSTRINRFIYTKLLPLLEPDEHHRALLTAGFPTLSEEGQPFSGITLHIEERNSAFNLGVALLELIPEHFVSAALREFFAPTIKVVGNSLALKYAQSGSALKAAGLYRDMGELTLATAMLEQAFATPASFDVKTFTTLLEGEATSTLANDAMLCCAAITLSTLDPLKSLRGLQNIEASIDLMDVDKRARVQLLRAFSYLQNGQCRTTLRTLADGLFLSEGTQRLAKQLQARALLRSGKLAEAKRLWAESLEKPGGWACIGGWLREAQVHEHLYDGNWRSASALLSSITCNAVTAPAQAVIVHNIVDMLIYSWLGGLDAESTSARLWLERLCSGSGVGATAKAARRFLHGEATNLPERWFICVQRVVEARTSQEARHWAQELLSTIAGIEMPLLAIAARMVVGAILFDEKPRMIAECLELARSTESLSLQAGVTAWSNGEEKWGMFAPLQQRLPSHASAAEETHFQLELFSGRLMRNNVPVAMSERSFEVLSALALRGNMSSVELAALIWPDLEPEAGTNALKQALHRSRVAAQSKTIVRFDQACYELSPEVSVDFRKLERLLKMATGNSRLPEGALSELEAVGRSFAEASSLSLLGRWEWSTSDLAYLQDLRQHALSHLARDAFHRADLPSMEEWIRLQLLFDPCDEEAHALTIQAALSEGRRGAATRYYERYRQTLARDLDIHTEDKLRRLLADDNVAS